MYAIGRANEEESVSSESSWLSLEDGQYSVENSSDATGAIKNIHEDNPRFIHLNLSPGIDISPIGNRPNSNLNLDDWVAIGRGIGNNTRMEKLNVCMDGLDGLADDDGISSKESLETFLAGMSQNRSLADLSFSCFDFDRARLDVLNPFLVKNPNLARVEFSSCNLGVDGIRLLSAAFRLRDKPSGLKKICLYGHDINYDAVPHIIELCDSCPRLRDLELGCIDIGNRGCQELASLIGNRDSRLKHFLLRDAGGEDVIDDDGAVYLFQALNNNNSLKTLEIDSYCFDPRRWGDYLSSILCNTSSINATIQSNHTLEGIRREGMDDTVCFYLKANKERNKIKVIRKKIFGAHLQGNFDLGPFIGMNTKVLPNFLGLIEAGYDAMDAESGRSRASAFYRIIRNFPELRGFPSSDRKMRLRLEAENSALKSENENLKMRIEQLESEKSIKRKKCS